MVKRWLKKLQSAGIVSVCLYRKWRQGNTDNHHCKKRKGHRKKKYHCIFA